MGISYLREFFEARGTPFSPEHENGIVVVDLSNVVGTLAMATDVMRKTAIARRLLKEMCESFSEVHVVREGPRTQARELYRMSGILKTAGIQANRSVQDLSDVPSSLGYRVVDNALRRMFQRLDNVFWHTGITEADGAIFRLAAEKAEMGVSVYILSADADFCAALSTPTCTLVSMPRDNPEQFKSYDGIMLCDYVNSLVERIYVGESRCAEFRMDLEQIPEFLALLGSDDAPHEDSRSIKPYLMLIKRYAALRKGSYANMILATAGLVAARARVANESAVKTLTDAVAKIEAGASILGLSDRRWIRSKLGFYITCPRHYDNSLKEVRPTKYSCIMQQKWVSDVLLWKVLEDFAVCLEARLPEGPEDRQQGLSMISKMMVSPAQGTECKWAVWDHIIMNIKTILRGSKEYISVDLSPVEEGMTLDGLQDFVDLYRVTEPDAGEPLRGLMFPVPACRDDRADTGNDIRNVRRLLRNKAFQLYDETGCGSGRFHMFGTGFGDNDKVAVAYVVGRGHEREWAARINLRQELDDSSPLTLRSCVHQAYALETLHKFVTRQRTEPLCASGNCMLDDVEVLFGMLFESFTPNQPDWEMDYYNFVVSDAHTAAVCALTSFWAEAGLMMGPSESQTPIPASVQRIFACMMRALTFTIGRIMHFMMNGAFVYGLAKGLAIVPIYRSHHGTGLGCQFERTFTRPANSADSHQRWLGVLEYVEEAYTDLKSFLHEFVGLLANNGCEEEWVFYLAEHEDELFVSFFDIEVVGAFIKETQMQADDPDLATKCSTALPTTVEKMQTIANALAPKVATNARRRVATATAYPPEL